MEVLFQLNPIILTPLLFLILLWPVMKILPNKKKLPPSPLKLPVIGNLHQLGSLPHQDLHTLALKHGPIMLLHFGSVPVLIVSSAAWAREIMKTHDRNFASRPAYKAVKKLVYDCTDVAAAPYGEHWRKMKSILVLQLLSSRRVEAARSLVQEETALFVKKIRESSGEAVNLSEMFAKLNNDVICRSAFGRKYSESENGMKFLQLMSEFMELVWRIDIGDFIPWLGWISRVTGVDKRIDSVTKEMDRFLECVVQERLETREKYGDSFVDIMLDIEELSIDDRDCIKALILIKGCNISAGTIVMINAWAIGRDSVSWDEPEKFKPERFLNSSIDFKGLDFELTPFGSGRRGCPGITFALATIELLLANLMLKFEWNLPNGVKGKDLDMNEAPGITAHKAIPLLAFASQSQ